MRDVQPDSPDTIGRFIQMEGPSAHELNAKSMVAETRKQLRIYAKKVAKEGTNDFRLMLQAIARARTQYPDLSLEELGATLSPPIGKSGVNHRMRRLVQLAGEDLGGQDAPQT